MDYLKEAMQLLDSQNMLSNNNSNHTSKQQPQSQQQSQINGFTNNNLNGNNNNNNNKNAILNAMPKSMQENENILLTLNESKIAKKVQNKKVVVIGGGDTGNDCIATAIRHGAKSVINLEMQDIPPEMRDSKYNPWPEFPRVFKIDYGHSETIHKYGKDPRIYTVLAKEFIMAADDNSNECKGIKLIKLKWKDKKEQKPGMAPFEEIEGSEEIIECDMVFLAMGFIGPQKSTAENDKLDVEMDHTKGTFKVKYVVLYVCVCVCVCVFKGT